VESKDYMSIVALLLSIASLGMSIRTFLFNKSTKGIELRAQLLVKIADTKNLAANTEATILQLDPDSKEAQQFWPRAGEFRQRVEALYSRIDGMPAKKGVELYGSIFHDVHDLYTQILEMKKLTEAELAKQIKKENVA
jgi:ubiquinone biosynthesis protein UbiJ